MSEEHLVDHFPIVPSSASISDISTGRVFDGTDASSLLTRLNPLTNPTTYHWSSAIDGKPSWAILDDKTEILHVRAHDCPMPATPLHPTCYDCITSELSDDSEFVFMWKTTRAEELSQRSGESEPSTRPDGVDYAVQTAGTPIGELFDTLWSDVFGTVQYEIGGNSRLLLQHCGACSNPMDARLQQCADCVTSRATDGFPGADYIMFVKMIRPEDGMIRESSFPGLHEARQGRAVPPRFGSGGQASTRNNPNDTGDTKIYET